MWVLENEGDALKGMVVSTRPLRSTAHLIQARNYGSDQGRNSYLDGLVQKVRRSFLCLGTLTTADGQFVIEDKTISRHHLTVEVDSVTAADCVRTTVQKILAQAHTFDRQIPEPGPA
jgi:hypothetical protein